MKSIAMIPARMGSQRLPRKNLAKLGGIPLITRAIRKARAANVFDEIWVNSEHPAFGEIASEEGVNFHKRPEHLGNNHATSEQFVTEFLQSHPCDFLFQVHSIAPLLRQQDIREFTHEMQSERWDCLLSTEPIQIECAYQNNPVNFSWEQKTNSQDLFPVQRISWSITAWRRSTFLEAAAAGRCATYAGRVGFFPVSQMASHIIKTADDLRIAEALLPLLEELS